MVAYILVRFVRDTNSTHEVQRLSLQLRSSCTFPAVKGNIHPYLTGILRYSSLIPTTVPSTVNPHHAVLSSPVLEACRKVESRGGCRHHATGATSSPAAGIDQRRRSASSVRRWKGRLLITREAQIRDVTINRGQLKRCH